MLICGRGRWVLLRLLHFLRRLSPVAVISFLSLSLSPPLPRLLSRVGIPVVINSPQGLRRDQGVVYKLVMLRVLKSEAGKLVLRMERG